MKSRFDNVLKPVEKTEKRTMSVAEAAEYCGLSRPTIVKLLREGELPGALFGTTWRIPREEFKKAVEKRLRGNYKG